MKRIILAAAMLLCHIARPEKAARLEAALDAAGDKPREMTAEAYTDSVIANL